MDINEIAQGNKKSRGFYKVKSPTRGGARANSGRKPNTPNRYSMEGLMASIQAHTGRPFSEQVASNYAAAIERGDWGGVRDYDRVLLGKLVADKQQVETVNAEEVVDAKREAFAHALQALNNIPTVAVKNRATKDLK